ncbi:imm68 putative immunity domain-containing protein [Eggerthia catenaformis]|nr:imm68 putative immunity domain-containing protein [Eggerthia catenaformis]
MMYIENKYWTNYIGDSDDSPILIVYLVDKK